MPRPFFLPSPERVIEEVKGWRHSRENSPWLPIRDSDFKRLRVA
jgi:hypothetical protein